MKTIVLTTEQMVKMTALDKVWGSEVRLRGSFVFPQKYEYLRPLFESEQYQSYWETGLNFLSPEVDDIDFGYSYSLSKFKFISQMKRMAAAFKHYAKLHGKAYHHAYHLARYNEEVCIPTLDELQEAWFAEFSQLESEGHAGFDDEDECSCGGVGCAYCDSNIRGFKYDLA